MTNTEALEAAITAANENLNALQDAMSAEIRAIKDRHGDGIRAAKSALYDAESALKEAKSAAAAHPWEGRKVYKDVPIYSGWSSKQARTERVYGIVEVCRLGTAFAVAVASYSRPSLGRPFVRLLKKDGTPGLKFDRATGWGDGLVGWQLVEDEVAAG